MRQILILTFLAISIEFYAQVSLPANVKIHLPSYIENSNDNNNSEWLNKIKKENYGKENGSYWIVYSDRDDNQTYSGPQIGETYKKLFYGQKLIIADIRNNFALVYEQGKYTQTYPVIQGESKGWINLENLLLWDKCPMDKNKVFRKAVVLLNLDSKSVGEVTPKFLSDPESKALSGKAANKLEFYFVMKTAVVNGSNFYLLSKDWTIGSSIGGVNNLYGWLGEGNVSLWDNRLCFEPNWDSRAVSAYAQLNVKPLVLKSKESAIIYKRDGNCNSDSIYWKDDEFSTQRNNPAGHPCCLGHGV